MKEDEVKSLLNRGDIKEVLLEPSTVGARLVSESKGWQARINGEILASARKSVRVFASLDTAIEVLQNWGISNFEIKPFQLAAESEINTDHVIIKNNEGVLFENLQEHTSVSFENSHSIAVDMESLDQEIATVVIERSKEKARLKSKKEPGWMATIDGEVLSSSRREVRVFASLDTALETIKQYDGKAQFKVHL